jgi:Mg-chelatase subunit ChlD
LGPLSHPTVSGVRRLEDMPAGAGKIEFDEEESLEASPLLDEVLFRFEQRKKFPVVIAVDTSLSMTGEKMALTAVALAVLLFQFSEDPISIVAFENEATLLQDPFRPLGVLGVIERFLDVPAQGYTDLEKGLKKALFEGHKVTSKLRGRPVSTLLLTDGKYTAGKNPTYLADRFPHLLILKTGDEASSLPLCQELALKGHGQVEIVPELQDLPNSMVRIVKGLLRGYRV